MAAAGLMAGCTNFSDFQNAVEFDVQGNYESAFVQRFGQPAETQDWGFSDYVAGTRGLTRSQASPEVPHLACPVSEADVTAYLATAKDPTASNHNHNNDNSHYEERHFVKTGGSVWVPEKGHYETVTTIKNVGGTDWGWMWQGTAYQLAYQYNESWFNKSSISDADKTFWDENCAPYEAKNWAFYGTNNQFDATTEVIRRVKESGRNGWLNIWTQGVKGGEQEVTEQRWVVDEPGHNEEEGYWVEAGWVYDEDFVRNFKISEGTSWNGNIGALGCEGDLACTIYVKGTWNVNSYQSIGGPGLVVICDGGTINVAQDQQLIFDNQSRLVVLPGGHLTGKGYVKLANGTADGRHAYNGGTIDVYKFDNNFGKLFNYGTFKPTVYAASSTNSNFYNHGIVHIKTMKENGSYQTPNARIFNACQWYCEEDMNFRNLEMTSGSSLIVGGELKAELSGDGTNDISYAALGAGALVKCGTFVNNQTCWTGPTSGGYAVISAGRVTYLNWNSDGNCLTNGYIENNIYIQVDDLTNNPDGNNYWREGVDMNAAWKLKYILANGLDGKPDGAGRGNGNTRLINKGDTEIAPADPEGFQLGVKGCSPGFNGDVTEIVVPEGSTEDPGNTEDNTSTSETTPEITQPEEHQTSSTTPAAGNPTNAVCCIIVEDLTVSQSSDFDFNDVVFDVCPNDDGATTTLIIRAVGGELPLYIEGQEVHQAIWGEICAKMMNTGRDGAIDFDKECGRITIGKYVASRAAAKDIVVEVTKMSTNIPLKSDAGKVASKIAVGTDYEWCGETQDIDRKYNVDGVKLFQQYVIGNYANDVWYRVLYESR